MPKSKKKSAKKTAKKKKAVIISKQKRGTVLGNEHVGFDPGLPHFHDDMMG